ncbi:hypothetical protein F511_44382 [Dorcoceras hygrometricum]|uniref:Uncharacterized protein n=1 Tax=Dorcoceras hygrometricum TaxID=472368 RepID=A0A2Z7BS93_9LAMI|nr:hypothetical protein F511_44382 [Dorcoceras hygrometricum]
MAIATIVATTLQGLVNPNNNQAPPPTPPPRGTKYYYDSLRKNKAPTFDGSPDAEVAQTWMKNIETQLRILEVPDAVKVYGAAGRVRLPAVSLIINLLDLRCVCRVFNRLLPESSGFLAGLVVAQYKVQI